MNLSDGGKNRKTPMRDTTWIDEDGKKHDQIIGFKGLQSVLEERGVWPESGLKKVDAQELLKEYSDFKSEKVHWK